MALINTRILMLVFCSNCLQLTLSLIRMYFSQNDNAIKFDYYRFRA